MNEVGGTAERSSFAMALKRLERSLLPLCNSDPPRLRGTDSWKEGSMSIYLKGCNRCGGDVVKEELPGYSPETVCLQCGNRGILTDSMRRDEQAVANTRKK